MKTMIFVAALVMALGACGKKSNDSGGGSGGGDKPDVDPDTPAEFTSWMSKDAATAWQGAWVTRMTLGKTMQTGRSFAALDIKGDGAKGFDGKKEYPLGFEVDTPCSVTISEPITEGSLKGGTSFHTKQFAVKGGKLLAGEGSVGMRKGKAAVVCGVSIDVTTLDDKGVCKSWNKRFGKWESKDQKCAWSQKDGKDVLTIGEGEGPKGLTADGDSLMDSQFADDVERGKHARAESYDAAKQTVIAKIKENDPGEQAKAAGGKVGDTTSVLGLIATFTSDPKALTGKPVEVTGLYYSSGSMTAGGKTTVSLEMIDSKDSRKLHITCYTSETDMKAITFTQYDKITAKGSVKESFHMPALDNCTATAAK